MGRIQSDIGLITGVPIGETVDKLMALAARPRDLLVRRTDAIKEEQAAVTELTTLLAAVQFVARNLAKTDLYDRRSVTTSNDQVLSATASQTAPAGRYQVTPLRLVRYQQLLSSGLVSTTAPIGAGTLRFRLGRSMHDTLDLALLRGGQGFVRGSIRITDRSGASAVVDLSTAQSLDDVVEAINGNTSLNISASTDGDRIRLVDQTGQTAANLQVQEVGGGTTAASLGLAGIDVAGSTALGQDIVWLDAQIALDALNDGNGVRIDRFLPDLEYHLRDGTTGTIDLAPPPSGGTQDSVVTLGDVIDAINQAAPGKLKVEIAPDGDRLQLVDLTVGTDEFSVRSLNESNVLHDLGLDGEPAEGVVVGRRLLAGLRTVLLASLNGGNGLGTLGQISLTDRSGASATVDLAGAETVDEVVNLINNAGVGITARVNAAGTGIQLTDVTGATTGNLIVANADETQAADKLGIAVNAAATSVSSGDLHLQIISYNTPLSALNGGRGVARGKFTIFDSAGKKASVNLADTQIQTIGDVVRRINGLVIGVQAELNETGDGIRLRDTAGGGGTLRVAEDGTSTAADMHLLRTATNVEIGGQSTQVIDGSFTYTVELAAGDTLDGLKNKINQLNAGLTASILYDGSTQPYRLVLQSDYPGMQGNWVVDAGELALGFDQVVRGANALLMFGDGGSGSGLLVSSTTNRFSQLVPGVALELKQASGTPVTITVARSDVDVVASVRTLVDNYNKFRTSLQKYTAYDSQTNKRSALTGDATALRLDSELLYLLSGTYSRAGAVTSLRQVGVSLTADGSLVFDETELRARFAQDPQGVAAFFADKTAGFATKLDNLIEQLAGTGASLLSARLKALSTKIETNQQRIDALNQQLERQREGLLLNFYRMEVAVAKILSAQSYIQNIKPIRITPRNSDE